MSEISELHSHNPASKPTTNPMLDLFSVPPTDISTTRARFVPIQTYTTGINPIEFQIDPQEDYIDLSRSYFEIEFQVKKTDNGNLAAADKLNPANNLAHTLFKQISVRLNGTLISPQTDTYHYKAFIETLLNYNRDDGETVLVPQGWYNGIDFPNAFNATNIEVDADGQNPHADYEALPENQRNSILLMRQEQANYTGGKKHVLRFKPHVEAFHLSKLLVPRVQIGIQMYLNSPNLYMNGHGLAARVPTDDIKVRFYVCQVQLNPYIYKKLMAKMTVEKKIVEYPTVRSEIRTFNMLGTQDRYECNNLFQGRIPNRLIVGLVRNEAFTGTVTNDPFCFEKLGLKSIKQLVRGEEYPYETLELVHNNATQDQRGYFRFLQASGCLYKHQGNMVRSKDWGQGKNCTLFMFDNVANGCVDSHRLNPKQAGDLQIVLYFGAPPGVNVTIILYGEFENLLEIDQNKAVLYDIYQR